MNKQLFEKMVQKVIMEAKEAMHKADEKQPGGDTSGVGSCDAFCLSLCCKKINIIESGEKNYAVLI